MAKFFHYFFKDIENLIFSSILLSSTIVLTFHWTNIISISDNTFSIFITLEISSAFLIFSSIMKTHQRFSFFSKLIGNYESYSFVYGPGENCSGMIEKHKIEKSKNGTMAKIEYLGKDELRINVDFVRNGEKNKWIGIAYMYSRCQGEIVWEYILFDGKYMPAKKDIYMKGVKKINIFYGKGDDISFTLNEIQNRNFRDKNYKIKSGDTKDELVLGEMKREIFQKIKLQK